MVSQAGLGRVVVGVPWLEDSRAGGLWVGRDSVVPKMAAYSDWEVCSLSP